MAEFLKVIKLKVNEFSFYLIVAVEEVAAPVAAEGEEAKKGAGRGKRKVKEASAEGSPPKRTLRSNSKTSLFDAPAPVVSSFPHQ